MLRASKIKPFLWFDDQAEPAARFYTSVFRNAKMGRIARYPEGSPRRAGMVMTVEFELEGHTFVALNGGPEFKFTEAVSFAVDCGTQEEIDYYWEKLTADGGKPVQCGWLKDKYGLCWQIYPGFLDAIYAGDDARKAERVMQAMLPMVKLDLRKLQQAAVSE